jgi:CRP/FNR family transcriptional regulator, cyclic AMP receptor protein
MRKRISGLWLAQKKAFKIQNKSPDGGKMKTEEIQWPCDLPESIKNSLLSSAYLYSLESGEHLVLGKGEANGLFYLLQGLVIVGIPDLSKSSPFVILKAGDWIGGTVIFKDSDFLYKIASIEYSKIIFIPDTVIRDTANICPELFKLLYLVVVDHARESVGMLTASAGMKMPQKVAYFLLEVAKRFPQVAGAHSMISMSQAMLAQMLGLSRLTLNQQLRALEKKNLVAIERKAIHILNVGALEAVANLDAINSLSRKKAKNVVREVIRLHQGLNRDWEVRPEI